MASKIKKDPSHTVLDSNNWSLFPDQAVCSKQLELLMNSVIPLKRFNLDKRNNFSGNDFFNGITLRAPKNVDVLAVLGL